MLVGQKSKKKVLKQEVLVALTMSKKLFISLKYLWDFYFYYLNLFMENVILSNPYFFTL